MIRSKAGTKLNPNKTIELSGGDILYGIQPRLQCSREILESKGPIH